MDDITFVLTLSPIASSIVIQIKLHQRKFKIYSLNLCTNEQFYEALASNKTIPIFEKCSPLTFSFFWCSFSLTSSSFFINFRKTVKYFKSLAFSANDSPVDFSHIIKKCSFALSSFTFIKNSYPSQYLPYS